MPLLITLENAQLVLSDSQVEEIANIIAEKIGVTQNAPLDLRQAAAALGVSTATISRRIKAGIIATIPHVGPIRISRMEIRRLQEGR